MTSSTTRKRVQELADHQLSPKEVVRVVMHEQGGELEAKGLSHLPRNRKQVVNARSKNKGAKDKDPLYSIMLECKLSQGSSCLGC